MKIGDTLYRFDSNRRVYANGNSGPIYSEHFEPLKIVGENKVSWLLERGWKASKKDLRSAVSLQYGGRGFFTVEGMIDDIWKRDHGPRIGRLVDNATPNQLRQIGAILGYDPALKER
jgi:hypothetical protein